MEGSEPGTLWNAIGLKLIGPFFYKGHPFWDPLPQDYVLYIRVTVQPSLVCPKARRVRSAGPLIRGLSVVTPVRSVGVLLKDPVVKRELLGYNRGPYILGTCRGLIENVLHTI